MALSRRANPSGPLVLVGFAEAYAAIEATWSLQEAGYRVAAYTRAGGRPALRRVRGVAIHDVHSPEDGVEQTAADVHGLVASLRPAAYLPLDDESVWLLKSLSADDVAIAGPTGRAVEYALDKRLQIEAAAAAGLTVPPTQVVDSLEAVRPDKYPAVVKPARALYESGGKLVRPIGSVCADEREFAAVAAKPWLPSILIQPLLRGTGEGLFGHVGRDGVVGWSAHRRVRMVNPAGSASSACESHPVDPELLQPAERFLREIGWRGLFMLEFLRDRDGTPWLMELNGRAWGSLALARRRGFEYPAWTVSSALDDDFVPAVPANLDGADRLLCRHLGMEIVHLAFVLRGPQSVALTEWPGLWPTLRDLLRVSRRDRLYNWKRSEPDVLAADTVEMVRSYLRRARGGGR